MKVLMLTAFFPHAFIETIIAWLQNIMLPLAASLGVKGLKNARALDRWKDPASKPVKEMTHIEVEPQIPGHDDSMV